MKILNEEALKAPLTGERTTIRDFSGRVRGYVDMSPTGDKTLRTTSGTIKGFYKAKDNVTTTPSGKILMRGDTLMMLLDKDFN